MSRLKCATSATSCKSGIDASFFFFFLTPHTILRAHVVIRDTPSVHRWLLSMAAAIFNFDQKSLVGQRMALETFQGRKGTATTSHLNPLSLNTHTHAHKHALTSIFPFRMIRTKWRSRPQETNVEYCKRFIL